MIVKYVFYDEFILPQTTQIITNFYLKV